MLTNEDIDGLLLREDRHREAGPVLLQIRHLFGGLPCTLADLLDAGVDFPESAGATRRHVGWWLRNIEGEWIDGFRLIKVGKSSGSVRYRLLTHPHGAQRYEAWTAQRGLPPRAGRAAPAGHRTVQHLTEKGDNE